MILPLSVVWWKQQIDGNENNKQIRTNVLEIDRGFLALFYCVTLWQFNKKKDWEDNINRIILAIILSTTQAERIPVSQYNIKSVHILLIPI